MLAGDEALRHTLRTRGARAGGIWFRNLDQTLDGIYPLNVAPTSPLAKGGKVDEKTGLVKIGELRCGRCQSIICGLHPSNVFYQWLETQTPIEYKPRNLPWPEEILSQFPWNKQPKKKAPSVAAGAAANASTPEDKTLLEETKSLLPIHPVLWHHFGFPDPAGNPTNSPLRKDEHPSFSLLDDGRHAYDHALQKHYDAFDFFQEATGKDASHAFRPFVTLAGLGSRLRGKTTKTTPASAPATAAAPPTHDLRPLIVHPGPDRYISEFAADLARILKNKDFFQFRNRPVHLRTITEKAHSGKEYETKKLVEIPPILFAGLIEQYCRPVQKGNYSSISIELAARTLPLPVFLDQLPIVTLWTDSRIPCLPFLPQMPIFLSEPGYDPRTGIYTSPDAPEINDSLSLDEAVGAWRTLLSEFCFPEDDIERSISVALAAALTPFCISLLPEKAKRPGFAASANAEGAGKTLLLSFGMVAKVGFVPAGATPTDEEEIRKVIDGAAHQAVPILFFDNLKGYLSSGALEAFLTTYTWRYRLLGTTNYTETTNAATVYLTANFATYSPDLRRRLLAVELFLEEARAEDRSIKNYLNEEKLVAMRPELLSIFWAMVKDWDRKGRPFSLKMLPTFETWSKTVGGIVENAGFISPCQLTDLKTGGDTQTRDIEALVIAMVPGTHYKFADLVELATDEHLFSWLIPPAGTIGRSENARLAAIFRQAIGRVFNRYYKFCLRPGSWRTEAYFVLDLKECVPN